MRENEPMCLLTDECPDRQVYKLKRNCIQHKSKGKFNTYFKADEPETH